MTRAMHTGFAYAGVCVALFLSAPAALANPVAPGVAEIEFGYMCQLESSEDVIAEDTIAGTISNIIGSPEFQRLGTTVPAQIGIEFGILARVLPEYEGPVSFQVEHPPQGAAGVTRESWSAFLSASEMSFAGFSFEKQYELTPGEWTLSAMSNGQLIYAVTFDVVAPMGSPLDDLGCDGPALVS